MKTLSKGCQRILNHKHFRPPFTINKLHIIGGLPNLIGWGSNDWCWLPSRKSWQHQTSEQDFRATKWADSKTFTTGFTQIVNSPCFAKAQMQAAKGDLLICSQPLWPLSYAPRCYWLLWTCSDGKKQPSTRHSLASCGFGAKIAAKEIWELSGKSIGFLKLLKWTFIQLLLFTQDWVDGDQVLADSCAYRIVIWQGLDRPDRSSICTLWEFSETELLAQLEVTGGSVPLASKVKGRTVQLKLSHVVRSTKRMLQRWQMCGAILA